MARILCSFSGLELKVSHFPIYNTARESHHPLFDSSVSNLLALKENYLNQEFTDIENYLYYLALFNATELVEFRVPAIFHEKTASIVANNCISLINMLTRIHILGNEKVINTLNLPRFVITADTKTLAGSKDWLSIWESNYKDYQTGYKTSTALEKISRSELNLERYIKDKTKDVSSYAGLLATWAEVAGQFPTCDAGLDSSILGGQKMTLAAYWKHIIRACAKKEPVYGIPDSDIAELIEHCEENLHQSGIFFFELMSLLRNASKKKYTYLSLGDVDITSTYRILDENASIEDANMLAMIDSAPAEKPVESHYPNKLAYIRAKMKYDLATSYKAEHGVMEIANGEKDMQGALNKRATDFNNNERPNLENL